MWVVTTLGFDLQHGGNHIPTPHPGGEQDRGGWMSDRKVGFALGF
jgi:hypothetical protein